MNLKITTEPKAVFNEYKNGNEYKASIGTKGIFEQSKINERMYVGDQWYGVKCGSDKPLVRRNVIKRIGEQKLSSIAVAPVAVNYSAEGIPNNQSLNEDTQDLKKAILDGGEFIGTAEPSEIAFMTEVLSEYWRITAERVKFDIKKEELLRKCYISGTGIAYTYWDETINTGLFADENSTTEIMGDIMFEVIDVENIVFGEPNNDRIQNQPYIIVSQRVDYAEVLRRAQKNGISKEERDNIKPDGADTYNANAGTIGEREPTDSKRVTVLTKFWKDWNKDGTGYRIMCEQVTENAHVRKPWDIGVKNYPFAKMSWVPRYSCIYGDSEITHMIPNQIAINRALSAEIWGIMKTGMPVTVLNGDIITDTYTNTPGQVLKVFGSAEDVAGAIRHVQPPAFAGQLITAVDNLATNTLSDNGANDAALGNLRPDNAAAIIQLREAALQPMQLIQNRFYDFVEDVARIWADFWLSNYGDRKLKYENKDGTYYVPFHASRYDKLLLTARVDVGSSPLWDVSSTVAMLDGMFANQIINKQQYLDRIPAGIVPDLTGLIEDTKAEMQAQEDGNLMQMLAQQYPEIYAKFGSLPPEQQQQILAKISGGQMSAPQGV